MQFQSALFVVRFGLRRLWKIKKLIQIGCKMFINTIVIISILLNVVRVVERGLYHKGVALAMNVDAKECQLILI
jgi:hypothetical protein